MSNYSSFESRIVVLSTVVNDELSVGEVKAVRFNFPRCFNDLHHFVLTQFGQVIDELPGVCAVWNHKAKLKAIVTNDSASEVVALDHLHVLDWFFPD